MVIFRSERRFQYLSLAPSVTVILLLGLVPVIYTFVLSLMRYELTLPPARFIGLANYVSLFLNNPRYMHTLAFTLAFATLATCLELIAGFSLAALLSDKEISESLSRIIRTVLLLPYVAAPVVISYIFKTLIYDPTFGYLNYFLRLLGLGTFDIFRGAYRAPIGVLAMEVILRTPFVTLILYAGISSIDVSIFDAADIDGVSWLQKMSKVILPIIQPIAGVAFILRFMDALKLFTEIYVVTAGGPGYVTETISVFTVQQAFAYFHMGYAAASAFVFFVAVMILVSFFLRLLENRT
jgi:multiple sugar transport system permease protein